MKYILPLLILSLPVQADWYFELGFGLTKMETGQPEVNLPSPLAKGVIGIEAQNGWVLELEHISSTQKAEKGSGLNVLWATKRIYF